MGKYPILPILDNRITIYLDRDDPSLSLNLEVKKEDKIQQFLEDVYKGLINQAKIKEETFIHSMNGEEIEIQKTQ